MAKKTLADAIEKDKVSSLLILIRVSIVLLS